MGTQGGQARGALPVAGGWACRARGSPGGLFPAGEEVGEAATAAAAAAAARNSGPSAQPPGCFHHGLELGVAGAPFRERTESETYRWGHGRSGRWSLTVARLGGVPPAGSQLNPPVWSKRVSWGLCGQPGQAPHGWQTHRGSPRR